MPVGTGIGRIATGIALPRCAFCTSPGASAIDHSSVPPPVFAMCSASSALPPNPTENESVPGVTSATGSAAKFAITVQSATTGSVVKTVPTSEPPQVPPTLSIWNPASGVSANAGVAPSPTSCGVEGLIVPDGVPTLGVTVCVTTTAMKFAMTVQSALTGFVVNTVPARLPPQVPPTLSIVKPGSGVSVKLVVAPSVTVCGVDGVIVPDGAPTLGVTTCVTGAFGFSSAPIVVCKGGRGSPSKSSLTPPIGTPAPFAGLAICTCRSTDAAFPFGATKSGSIAMLLGSCAVALRQSASVS